MATELMDFLIHNLKSIISEEIKLVLSKSGDLAPQRKGYLETDQGQLDYQIVERDEDLIQVKDRLMRGFAGLQVGKGGIGKTSLAKFVYEDPLIGEHFDIRVSVKVPSIEYHLRDKLVGLLQTMNKLGDGIHQKTDDQLAEHLYNSKHKRYLIVVDDIWKFAVWKELFPDYKNGSRILLTTRNVDLAPDPPDPLNHPPRQLDFREGPWPPKLFAEPSKWVSPGIVMVTSCAAAAVVPVLPTDGATYHAFLVCLMVAYSSASSAMFLLRKKPKAARLLRIAAAISMASAVALFLPMVYGGGV